MSKWSELAGRGISYMVLNREARIQDEDPQERAKGSAHSRTEGIPQNPRGGWSWLDIKVRILKED